MRIRLLGHMLEVEKGLRPAQPLAAPGRKQGARHVSPLLQPRIEHVPVLPLDGNELLEAQKTGEVTLLGIDGALRLPRHLRAEVLLYQGHETRLVITLSFRQTLC